MGKGGARSDNMKRTILVELECDTEDSLKFIAHDILQEISCCTTSWESIKIAEKIHITHCI